MGNCFSALRTGTEGGKEGLDSVAAGSPTGNGSLIEAKSKVPEEIDGDAVESSQDDVVRRIINQELAEFRQQLKKSQDLLHAMNSGSVSAISLGTVTQSCPILAESEVTIVPKPTLVTCSTQTDQALHSVIPYRRSSTQDGPARSLLDAIDDDGDSDGNYLDKLSDDISYRLTVNLPTVLEESDPETDSPGRGGGRRMSDGQQGKKHPRLVRSNNAHDEDPESLHHNQNNGSNKSVADDGGSSDTEFVSVASSFPGSNSLSSSAYNSLERPLQMGSCGRHNGDSDSPSSVSDGNSTFASPLLSFPSSPTYYWTPLGGSSSQETITNMDGDKTPVNEENGHGRLETLSCPGGNSHRKSEVNGSFRKRGGSTSSCGPEFPTYKHNEAASMGVIPESKLNQLKEYAFDVPRRKSELEAIKMLPGKDWRTLHMDLDKEDQDKYRKRYAQEEGNDVEEGLFVESAFQRPSTVPDLEEEAEEYLERFPEVVENLFVHLDTLKQSKDSLAEPEMESISKRFNHLAHTFKVEHCNLTQRKDINLGNHQHSTTEMNRLKRNLIEIVQKFEDIGNKTKVPEDIAQQISLLKHIPEDLSMYTQELSKTSRRIGMMDVQVRLYKMIEVMVLYVHILRNLCDEKDKEVQSANNLLKQHNIPHTRTKPITPVNNNNNEKIAWGDELDSSCSSKEDEKPQFIQHLLGPKQSNGDADYRRSGEVEVKENSNANPVVRFLSDSYETLRCEFFWPWNWDETWRGMKQGFSIVLMAVGLIIIFRSLFPIVSANDPPAVADLGSVFSKHGNLHHGKVPPV